MIISLLSWAHTDTKHTFGSALSVFVSKPTVLGNSGTAQKPADETCLDSSSANQNFTVSNWSIL